MGFGISIPFFANNRVAASSYDADAQAFFTAAGITDATQKSAVNQLVLDLKADSLWSKFYAIYPFVGGTSTTHKYNLVNPVDSDAAYRLAFSGTITHDSNGITPDGIDGIGDTKINPNTVGGSAWHMNCYVRTNTVGNKYDMGVFAAGSEWACIARYTGNTAYSTFDSSYAASVASTDARGFWSANRHSGTTYLYKNGSSVATGGGFATYNNNIGIGGQVGRGALYSDRNIALASVGEGLDSTEQSNFYTAVQAFQTTLGRNV